MKKRIKKKSGSVLVLAMIFSAIMAFTLGSLIKMQNYSHKINIQNLNRTRALHQAESGIQLVMHEVAHKAIGVRFGAGWTVAGDAYTYTDSDGTLYSMTVTGL